VLLSAQSTDVGVNKATRRLYPVANTPQAILDLGLDELKTYISTIGLYNNKAKNVIATCEILVTSTAAKCRARARRWKPCPASAARPPTWC
jgi:endonuclease III